MFHADRKAHSSKCMVIKKCRFLSKVHTSNILQWREFTGVSPGNFEKGTEPGDGPPVQSRGKAPVRGPSDDIPPQKKLNQNVKMAITVFNVLQYKIQDLTSNSKNSELPMGLSPLSRRPFWVRQSGRFQKVNIWCNVVVLLRWLRTMAGKGTG